MLADHVVVRADADLRATALLVRRVRRWLDLDADPAAIDDALGADPVLAPLVDARPGLRVPTTVDPWETVVRAIVGQQVSVAGARTILGRIVAAYGEPAAQGFTAFPTAADASPRSTPATSRRSGCRGRVAARCTRSRPPWPPARSTSAPATPTRSPPRCSRCPASAPGPRRTCGCGRSAIPTPSPRPTSACATSALALGLPDRARDLAARAAAWSPWRSYAAQHLWTRPEETP